MINIPANRISWAALGQFIIDMEFHTYKMCTLWFYLLFKVLPYAFLFVTKLTYDVWIVDTGLKSFR